MTNQGAAGRYPGGGQGGGGGRRGPGGTVGMLHVVGGNDRGKQYPLVNPSTAIGRGADQDFILADIAASRRHVVVLIEGDRYRLNDLGSGNGTLINGARVHTALLSDGDQIEIGNSLLRFDHPVSRGRAPTISALGSAPPPRAQPPQQFGQPPQAYEPTPTPMPYSAVNPNPMPGSDPHMTMPPGTMAPYIPSPASNPFIPNPGSDGFLAAPDPTGGIPEPPPRVAPILVGKARGPNILSTVLATNTGKATVFGTAGAVVLFGLVLVLLRSSGGHTADPAEPQRLYVDGSRAFASGDYVRAKKLFGDALQLAPDQPQTARYLKLCDVELHAQSSIKNAQALATARRFDDELKELDSIDRTSASFDEAEKLRKAAIPNAVNGYLTEARMSLVSDPVIARQKVDAALTLDPESREAKELDQRLRGSAAVAPPPAHAAAQPAPAQHAAAEPAPQRRQQAQPQAQKEEAAPRETKKQKKAREAQEKKQAQDDARRQREEQKQAQREQAQPARRAQPARNNSDDDDDDAGGSSSGGGGDLLSNRGALGPYRAKDFNGSATALRVQARSQSGSAAQKNISLASQITQLGSLYAKAESDKNGNPVGAVNSYQQAMALDNQLSKGIHGAYFKGQLGKLSSQAGQQAFDQGKYDSAFEMAKSAQRYGGSDGGLTGKLHSKAAELNGKAAQMSRSNPNGAKNLWRQILRMVPANDPLYTRATQGLSSGAGAPKDDDDD